MSFPISVISNFQQDGAHAHYAKDVRQRLDEKFPRRWIGSREPIEWPARSLDLTVPDFFSMGSFTKTQFMLISLGQLIN